MFTGLIQKTYDGLLILFFLSVLSIPLVTGFVVDDKKWSEAERRVLETRPLLPTSVAETFSFPQKFEKYYRDHFGFREEMIYRYHREMEKRFDMAGTPIVLKGQGKWLFFNHNNMFKDYLGEIELTRPEIEAWLREQQQRYQWLKDRGIRYLSFSPPNKLTVYGEFLPDGFSRIKGLTRLEQLHKYLADAPPPFYLNVHNAIINSKPERKLYYQTDTHWNHYGAYVCFKEVMGKIQQLFPDEKFRTDFPFYKHSQVGPGGDLAGMLMIDRKVHERNPKMRVWQNCAQQVVFEVGLTDVSDKKYETPLLKKCSKASLNAIVFSDSFITNLEPFLSENFGQVLYLRKRYDQRNVEELLESFRPDIVIEERVERQYFP